MERVARAYVEQEHEEDSEITDRAEEILSMPWPIEEFLNLELLPSFAVSVRNAKDNKAFTAFECYVGSMSRKFSHIFYPLHFSDGCTWIIKIPGHGSPGGFTKSDRQALISEVMTMRLVKRETSIPVPEVYSFDGSHDNYPGHPYILMEHTDAVEAYDVWFDRSVPESIREQRRRRILDSLAAAVVQLEQMIYPMGGKLLFSIDGKLDGIGCFRIRDWRATMFKICSRDEWERHPFPVMQEFKEPFTDPKAFMPGIFDLPLEHYYGTQPLRNKADQALLRLLCKWIDATDTKFILNHQDLDLQHIRVSEDGEIRAIIGWEWVSAMPRFIGEAIYPQMLIGDWVCPSDSSGEIPSDHQSEARYRKFYQECRLTYRAKLWEGQTNSKARLGDRPLPSSFSATAHRCLIIALLFRAASNSFDTSSILQKLLAEVWNQRPPQLSGPKSLADRKRDTKEDSSDTASNTSRQDSDGQDEIPGTPTTEVDAASAMDDDLTDEGSDPEFYDEIETHLRGMHNRLFYIGEELFDGNIDESDRRIETLKDAFLAYYNA